MLRHTATRVCRPYMSTSTSLSLCVVCIPPVQVADNQKNHKWPLLLTTPGRHRPVSIHRVVKAHLYTNNPHFHQLKDNHFNLFVGFGLSCESVKFGLCVVGDDVISKGRNCWGFLYIISIYVYCLIYYIAFCFNPLY
jgi:hypothetical protein